MPDAKKTPPQKLPDSPQPLVGFMTNEAWDELLGQVDALVQDMDNLPYPDVKEKVFALLGGIDAIHREALGRLVRLFKEGVLEKVVTDPTIQTLMELYDLLPAEAKPVDEQLAKIRFTRSPGKREAKPTPASVAPTPKGPSYPHWVPVLKQSQELPAGAVKECQVDDHRIVVCRVEDAFFAVDAACAQDNSSLAGAKLNKYTLTCPHHTGCYYDVRHGARIAGTVKIECYPIKQEDDGRVLVGINMVFEPKLPAF